VRFGRKPKLTAPQLAHVRKLIEQGEAVPEVAKLLSVDRATIYRALQRAP
jgi:DNA invertase Pin-like site-specific DNA recombinase